MALIYKTPDQIADDYLTYLKGVKPEVDTSQTDNDWWIRSRPVGGVVAGVYSDQRNVSNDCFPGSARHDALGNHLSTYLNRTFISAQPSEGNLLVTGASGSVIDTSFTAVYEPNGNVYQATTGVDFGAATAVLVPVQSVEAGQNQNLLSGAPLSIPSPPPGVNSNCSASGNIADGRDTEADDEAKAAVLAFIQTPPQGGNQTDYEAWAKAADASVTNATTIRYPYGFGSVGVVITSGTTNIDTALDQGEPIVRVPSQALIDIVEAYLETLSPASDCPVVFGAVEVAVDVTVHARFAQGNVSTVLSGQTLTQGELVAREVQRALYKFPPGGRKVGTPASGFVLRSEIEDVVDLGLSAGPYVPGTNPIMTDRVIDDLAASGPNLLLANTQIAAPGTITVVDM